VLSSIIKVDPGASENLEQIGSKEKFWFTHEELGRCVFKAARANTGEDWAEVVAAEGADLLGLPHASYYLAESGGQRGVVTPRFLAEAEDLVHGNEVLAGLFASYDPNVPYYQQTQHTLEKVFEAVEQSDLPPRGWTPPVAVSKAQDLFVGYLLLDAWLGNTDRHDLNWGFVEGSEDADATDEITYLAPTFDHASSLGRELTEKNKKRRLNTNDPQFQVEAYAERARSALYRNPDDANPMGTMEVLDEAVRRRPEAACAWTNRLTNLHNNALREAFNKLPSGRISEASIDFALRMTAHNRNRITNLEDAV
jgi:hypothetical protein